MLKPRSSSFDSLLNREVEVFWPEEDAWFPGVVVEKGLDPDSSAAKDHPDGEGVGWKVCYDDGDEGWIPNLRNNSLVRFLGTSVRSGPPTEVLSEQQTVTTSTQFRKQTTSSAAAPFVNAERDWIAQAFAPASFVTLRKIPSHVKAGAVEAKTKNLAQANVEVGTRYIEPLHVRKTGFFCEYEHMHSDYDLQRDQTKEAWRASETKRCAISEQPFMPCGIEAKLKHEALFSDDKFSYKAEPFEGEREQRRKLRWIAESKQLHGRFECSGRAGGLHVPTRQLLPSVIAKVHRILKEDWADSNFAVMVDDEDAILVRFDVRTIGSPRALMGYMNTMIRDTSQFLKSSLWFREFQLRAVAEDWGREDGQGGVVFMFRPPWVKNHHLDTFLTLNPESRMVPERLKKRILPSPIKHLHRPRIHTFNPTTKSKPAPKHVRPRGSTRG